DLDSMQASGASASVAAPAASLIAPSASVAAAPAMPALASAAPAKPAADAGTSKTSLDARREFLNVAERTPSEAGEAWVRLVTADETALEDPDIQTKTLALLASADLRKRAAVKVFEKLATGSGALALEGVSRLVEGTHV